MKIGEPKPCLREKRQTELIADLEGAAGSFNYLSFNVGFVFPDVQKKRNDEQCGRNCHQ
jgi:hypothetical protein